MVDAKHTWSLAQWLNHLETLHPKHMDFNLSRLQPLVQRLGIGSFHCPVITVAGTNGKGSVVALLSVAYQAAGLKVASTTSPHLLRVNERACINDECITDVQLIAALAHVEAHRKDLSLTYFEFLAFAILSHFKQCKPDIVILEVGLGGRLDMMNVVSNDCAVITSIALDHVQQLGATRQLIAKEKCGIFKSHALAVCGDVNPPAAVAQVAEDHHCQLYQVARDFSIENTSGTAWRWTMGTHQLAMPATALKKQNVATALAVLAVMEMEHALPVPWAALPTLLSKCQLSGRQQRLSLKGKPGVTLLMDVAHNAQSAQSLCQVLHKDATSKKVHMVFAVLQSKDIALMLGAFKSCSAVWYLAPIQQHLSVPPAQMMAKLSDIGHYDCYSYRSIAESFEAAYKAARSGETVVVWGSFHTVAEVMLCLNQRNQHHA